MNQINVHRMRKLHFALIRYGKLRGDPKDWIKFIGTKQKYNCLFAMWTSNA